MYSKEDVVKLFNSSSLLAKEVISVLIKDHNYKFEFAKIIQKEFDISDFSENDINDEFELDLQVLDREEKFNVPHKEPDLVDEEN